METISAQDRKRLADKLGMSEQYLYQCLTGRRDMDHAAAVRAEKDTAGELTRQLLCQNSYAAVWPELAPKKRSAKNANR